MNRLIRALTGRASILGLLVSLLILESILILSIFIPNLGAFLAESSLFEILVITALFEILLLLGTTALQQSPAAISDETAAHGMIRELIDRDKTIKKVWVLSAGMGSRSSFLRHLLEHQAKLEVNVVACFGGANPDPLDREKIGPAQFEVLTNRLEPETSARLRVFQSANAPSFRCILLSSQNAARAAFISWYTYHKGNTRIHGRKNLQLFVDSSSVLGLELLSFAERKVQEAVGDEGTEQLWPPRAPKTG